MSRNRRRGCGPVTLLILLALVAGLLVVGDRLAVRQAEGFVAENLRTRSRLDTTPQVTIHGFPFLTQVAARRFDRVDLEGTGVPAGTPERPLRVDRMDLRLSGVDTANNYRQISASDLDGTASVTWGEIGKQVGAQVAPERDGRIRVELTAGIYGQRVPVVVSARPVLDVPSQKVHLSEPRALVARYQVPDVVVERVVAENVPPVDLNLPLSLRASGLTVRRDHLDLGLQGTDIQLVN